MTNCALCGQKEESPRSVQQRKRFFNVLVPTAFLMWPETHKFQPETERHLRKWLLMRGGWHRMHTVKFDEYSEQAIEASVLVLKKMASEIHDDYVFTHVDIANKRITAYTAKSTRNGEMSHEEACMFFRACEEIVIQTLGISSIEEVGIKD